MGRAYRTARYLTGDASLAEDIVHDVVVKALKAQDTLRDGAPLRPWIFAILRNTVIDHYRRQGKQFRHVSLEALEDHHDPALVDAPLDVKVLNRVMDEEIERALAQLPEEMRLAVLLADVEGLTYKEIAQVLHWPAGTVMSRLYRGRQKLRHHLKHYARQLGYRP
ncbi:MAG: RNA polymerase sigma factor [Ardenticatenia bacterium]|nr:RNA polymerase sigma factor [Ardenticatenia bacterium]